MTLDDVDRTMATWKERLAQVDQNLIALHDADYALIESTASRLAGVTADRASKAIAAMRALFDQRQMVEDVLTRVRTARASVSRVWPSRGQLQDIASLLLGPSVTLATTQTPIAQRGLLSSPRNLTRVTLDEALNAMKAEFDLVQAIVAEVTQAWQRLNPALDAFNLKFGALVGFAGGLGIAVEGDLASLRAEVDGLRARIAADPIGTQAEFDATIQPRLRALNDRLEELARHRTDVQTLLAEARRHLDALCDAHKEAVGRLAQCQAEIMDPIGAILPMGDEEMTKLTAWLGKLEDTVGAGHWPAAEVGLRRFAESVQETLAREEKAAAANRILAESRDELRGRLAARRAQLKQLRARGIKAEPGLEGEVDELARLLGLTPTPLGAISRQFTSFEERVRGLGRG